MELKDGDIYEHNYSGVKFKLKQESPVSWSLMHDVRNLSDYPIYPESYIISLLEKNFKKVDNNA